MMIYLLYKHSSSNDYIQYTLKESHSRSVDKLRTRSNDGLSPTRPHHFGNTRGRLLRVHEESEAFKEARDRAHPPNTVPGQSGPVGASPVSHGGRDPEGVRPRAGGKVRGDVRVHHPVDNNPRPGADKNDRGEGDHEFHESPAVRGREGGSYAGRGVVRDAGRPVEGAQDNADLSVHLEQDQVHVRAHVRLREKIRRLSVEGGS